MLIDINTIHPVYTNFHFFILRDQDSLEESARICVRRRVLTLPGYFLSTKLWDMLVVYKGELVAAIEFKSQVDSSFGDNFDNLAEEAIGTAHDVWIAYREALSGRMCLVHFLGG